jgi:hypothetical protein
MKKLTLPLNISQTLMPAESLPAGNVMRLYSVSNVDEYAEERQFF